MGDINKVGMLYVAIFISIAYTQNNPVMSVYAEQNKTRFPLGNLVLLLQTVLQNFFTLNIDLFINYCTTGINKWFNRSKVVFIATIR